MAHPLVISLGRLAAILSVAALSACAGSRGGWVSGHRGPAYAGLECAPFARELSGIALYGDAAAWWDGAEGRYARSDRPAIGGVLVFRRSDRLPYGHVSVVSRLLGARQVSVVQANWVPGELDEDQLVVDVSDANDWTAVRVWYPPVNQLGAHTYETFGFILPPGPATHDSLLRASHRAAVLAVSARYGRPLPSAQAGF